MFTFVDWLADAFDLGQLYRVVKAGRGQTNPFGVLRLETSKGIFAIKQFEQPPSPVALAIELAASKTGFSMPQPIWTRDGVPYAAYLDAGSFLYVRVYSWIEGTPYDWGFVDPQVSTVVGGLLAAMHALPIPEQELQDDPWIPNGWQVWEQWTQQAEAKNITWAPALHQRIPVLVEWEEHILTHTVTDEPVVPSQRDLHPPNIIRCMDRSHAVVDWDAAGFVNAREEVAKFALVWATDSEQTSSKVAVHAFIQGYREAGGTFTSRGILDLTHQARSLFWWLTYNIRRDLSDDPGSDPDLTSALLSHVHPLDLKQLQRTADLFDF